MNENIINNGYKAVDLYLPSGTLWAACNVGALKPKDYGLYFQWGDTQGYTADQVGTRRGQKKFSSYGYKWNPSGDGKTFTKYASEGATLELEDDAANANMGGDWHIPTDNQIGELLDNTTNTWTEQDYVKGRLFTSKKDNSKSIFIPVAGASWFGLILASGGYGGIWSSVLNTGNINYGQCLYFSSRYIILHGDYRDYGFPVRGVIG